MDSLITVEDIKKEIDDEVEILVRWSQDVINAVDPLADIKAEEVEGTEHLHFPKVLIPDLVPKIETGLVSSSALLHDYPIKLEPNPLEELEVIKDLVSFQDIKPNILLKEEDELSNQGCQIENEGDIELQKMDSLIPVDDIKKEIDDEVELQVRWSQDIINAVDPLADIKAEEVEGTELLHFPKVLIPDLVSKVEAGLVSSSALLHDYRIKLEPNPLEELEVIKDLVSFQDIKPNLLLKEEDELSNQGCQIENEGDIELQKNETRNLEEEETVAPKKLSSSSYRRNLKTSSFNVHFPKGKRCNSEKLFKCNKCSYASARSDFLKLHMMRTHIGERRFKCKECLYTCALSGNLKRHMRTHSGERPFQCNTCLYTCAQSGGLKEHMRTHTGERPFQCNTCLYTCAQSGNLKKHMRTHTGDKCFKCKECTYTCAQSGALKQHMRTHTGERPFNCKECSYTCALSGNLKQHMRTHSGEKPFQCNTCLYTCAKSGTLKQHMRTHTGERPFQCNTCSYTCAKLGALKEHMRKHTGERPFQCNTCSYTCARSNVLKLHMRRHTGERPF